MGHQDLLLEAHEAWQVQGLEAEGKLEKAGGLL